MPDTAPGSPPPAPRAGWRDHRRLLLVVGGANLAVFSLTLLIWGSGAHGSVLLLLLPGLLLYPLLSTAIFAVARLTPWRPGTRGLWALHLLSLVGYLPLLLTIVESERFWHEARQRTRLICADVEIQAWRFTGLDDPGHRVLEVTVRSRAGGPLRLDFPMVFDASGSLLAFRCAEPGCEPHEVNLAPGQQVVLRAVLDAPESEARSMQFALCRAPDTQDCAWWVHERARGEFSSGALPAPGEGWPLR